MGASLPSIVEGTNMTKTDLIQGTLDMLILRVLDRGEMHGWGIAERIGRLSNEVLSVGEGSLYPALYRMQDKGWIASEWGQSDNNRRAKYYRLTKAGQKQLGSERETWDRLVLAVAEVMTSA
jgi:transcriptional regulator